jgi:hypothetical protein
MYMRAFVVRFAFLGVLSLGIALSAAFRQPVAHEAAPQALPKQAAVASAPLPVVTLSTVHVHADVSKAKPAAPARVETAPTPAGLTTVAAEHRGGGMAPTLRLDMPYYSFGKMLPRVGKE